MYPLETVGPANQDIWENSLSTLRVVCHFPYLFDDQQILSCVFSQHQSSAMAYAPSFSSSRNALCARAIVVRCFVLSQTEREVAACMASRGDDNSFPCPVGGVNQEPFNSRPGMRKGWSSYANFLSVAVSESQQEEMSLLRSYGKWLR